MPFTVEDFRDLLRLLDQHPEWRAELRRQVLSDELLELPRLVRELVDTQRQGQERLHALAEAQARTEQALAQLAERVTQLAERVTQLAEQVAQLAEGGTQLAERVTQLAERVTQLAERVTQLAERVTQLAERLTGLTARVDSLALQLSSLAGHVGSLEGEVLELRYARRAPAYFSPWLRRIRVLEPAALAQLLERAVEEGRLTEAERDEVVLADLVLSGRWREDQTEVYLVAELSVGIGLEDVQRAMKRAALLERLGRRVVPAVAGRWINSDADGLARSSRVWQLLDGRPSPPGAAQAS